MGRARFEKEEDIGDTRDKGNEITNIVVPDRHL